MPEYQDDRLEAVHIVESLRSGVPTRLSTRKLPELRPELTEVIRRDLETFQPGVAPKGRILWGAYGQGKSHFLTAMEHLGLDMGFAVSYVTLSREVSCDNLYRFYQRVAPAVRIPHSRVPGLLQPLMKKLVKDLDSSPLSDVLRYGHPRPAVVVELLLRYPGEEEVFALYNDLMGDYLTLSQIRQAARRVGQTPLLQNMPRFRQAEHASAYFGVLADLVRWCGGRGWMILVDEMELVGRLGKVKRLEAYRNLNWLLNWSGDMPFPIYTLCAAASSLEEMWRDETRSRRKESTAIPELAAQRYGGDAEKEMLRFFRMASGDYCLTLKPAPREPILGLLREIIRLHASAYSWQAPQEEEWLQRTLSILHGDEKLRTWIRLLLEALDVRMVSGRDPEIGVEELPEPSAGEDESFFVEN